MTKYYRPLKTFQGPPFTVDALRLFVAIAVPPEVLEILIDIQNRFKNLDLDAKWVKPENMHLTLKFLGKTSKVSQIKQGLAKALSNEPELTLSLGGTKVFPDIKRPRVLGVGLHSACEPLAQLHKNVEEHLAPLGFPPESRPFSPHWTLARIKSGKNKKLLAQQLNSIGHVASFKVKSVRLYQSRLTPEGAKYTVLEEFALKGTPN
ncbi:MAG TPA: RNA 2',3'-cyclic phosphodiesterase [Nitrospina sp.]|nr:RNA 2',3'-cyclic phosphodiesterase [Nitrospina sp.]